MQQVPVKTDLPLMSFHPTLRRATFQDNVKYLADASLDPLPSTGRSVPLSFRQSLSGYWVRAWSRIEKGNEE